MLIEILFHNSQEAERTRQTDSVRTIRQRDCVQNRASLISVHVLKLLAVVGDDRNDDQPEKHAHLSDNRTTLIIFVFEISTLIMSVFEIYQLVIDRHLVTVELHLLVLFVDMAAHLLTCQNRPVEVPAFKK